jgi:hypothetical protein
MPLQLGNWIINTNGFEGELFIKEVSATGVVTGSLNVIGANPISGFWNDAAQELTFAPLATTVGSVFPIFYKGYLFSSPPSIQLRPGQDFKSYLAGYFQMPTETTLVSPEVPKAHSRRNTFGWFAQIDVFM